MTTTSGAPGALSIVVLGASGDLAMRKIYPALFSLYCQGHLPADFNIFGFARTPFNVGRFRTHISEHLTCRYTPDHSCADRVREFLARCYYFAGAYSSRDSFLDLYSEMSKVETRPGASRVFYMAIPSAVFADTARAIGGYLWRRGRRGV